MDIFIGIALAFVVISVASIIFGSSKKERDEWDQAIEDGYEDENNSREH